MDLETLLMKQKKEVIVGIMMNALDLMQQYSGRSRLYCIMEAMGAESREDENGIISWKVPTKKTIEEHSNYL